MRRLLVPLLSVLLLAPTISLAEPPAKKEKATEPPRIDLTVLLDTSNSMDGLINQARAQLWKIVSEMATTKKNGQTPRLRVALYEYGNDGLPSDGGYVRQVLPLTDDLDSVSEKLFALTTNGGQEYCGQVIEAAVSGLDWSESNDDLKVIIIAGNEPFTQGPVDYKTACPAAIQKGIVINTIFCGDEQEGRNTGWEDGAKLADGMYSHIDQNQKVADVPTPYDAELATLGTKLNATYLAYGRVEDRERFLENQAAQDSNASGLGRGVAAQRASAKATPAYENSSRDLVDGLNQKSVELEKLDEAELPVELKGKSLKEQQKIVDAKSAERKALQVRIQELSAKRDAVIAEHRKQQAESGEASLDAAVIPALRQQAQEKQFEVQE